MTNKELQNLAENCGFGITEVHHAFYEKDNEFTEFARQIASICATIAANTNLEISSLIKKEFGL